MDRKPRTNGETTYFRCLKGENPLGGGVDSVMNKANRAMAIKTSKNPEFLKEVLKVEPDSKLRELAQQTLEGLGGGIRFLFD